MKTYIYSLILTMIGFTSLNAQFDDLYYNLNDSDVYSEDFDEYDYYENQDDEYSYDNEFYEDYDYFLEDDYYYSNRIRRFNRPNTFLVGGWNPYYGSFYNPYNYWNNFIVWDSPSFVISFGNRNAFVPGYWYGGYNYWPARGWGANPYRGWRNSGWGAGPGWGGGFGGGGFAGGGGFNDCVPGGGRFVNANNGTRFTSTSTSSSRGNYYGSRRSGSIASSDRGTNRSSVSQRATSRTERVRRGDATSGSSRSAVRSSENNSRYNYKGDAKRTSTSRADRRSQSRPSLGNSRSTSRPSATPRRNNSSRPSMGTSRSSSRSSSIRSSRGGGSSSRGTSRSSGRSGRGGR